MPDLPKNDIPGPSAGMRSAIQEEGLFDAVQNEEIFTGYASDQTDDDDGNCADDEDGGRNSGGGDPGGGSAVGCTPPVVRRIPDNMNTQANCTEVVAVKLSLQWNFGRKTQR